MGLAERGEESAVDDFAAFLLRMFDYEADGDRVIRQHPEVSFQMCGQSVSAKPDLAVCDDSECKLLVQEVNVSLPSVLSITSLNPVMQRGASHSSVGEAQLIAEAIAAFSENNWNRKMSGLPALESQAIPGILMSGVSPVFYRIFVGAELVRCACLGVYPTTPTVVHRCIPPVPNQPAYHTEGLLPLQNRRPVLQCFEAFKQFVV